MGAPAGTSDHPHDTHLAHHFESEEQQYESAKLGMWIFLATEILFFGGLFCAYSVYRANHPEIFLYAHQFLDKNLGAVNTVVLICSSFTMAWAVRAAQLRQKGILLLMLGMTFLAACGFLGIKYVEYSHKWHLGLLWAGSYDPHLEGHEEAGHMGGVVSDADEVGPEPGAGANPEPSTAPEAVSAAEPSAAGRTSGEGEAAYLAPAATGPGGLAEPAADDEHHAVAEPRNARTFFSIYFLMTGLHGIHVLGGMAAMLWLMFKASRGDFATGYFTPVDMVGLYWHLVDLIWIYLFLLLYLIH